MKIELTIPDPVADRLGVLLGEHHGRGLEETGRDFIALYLVRHLRSQLELAELQEEMQQARALAAARAGTAWPLEVKE